jgi:hypothetical protein
MKIWAKMTDPKCEKRQKLDFWPPEGLRVVGDNVIIYRVKMVWSFVCVHPSYPSSER